MSDADPNSGRPRVVVCRSHDKSLLGTSLSKLFLSLLAHFCLLASHQRTETTTGLSSSFAFRAAPPRSHSHTREKTSVLCFKKGVWVFCS